MSFGRWLLIHSFSIFLVVVFVGGYFYREELRLEQIYRQLLNEPETPPVQEKPAEPLIESEPPAREPSVVMSSPPPAAVAETSAPAPRVEPTMTESRPAATPAGDSSSGTATVSTQVIAQSDLLYRARRAYWDKDYQAAIRLYRQLIDEDGDNPDYIGELGNIYYSLNDFDNASEQFYRAALALLANGERERASLLVSPVTAMNRELGNQLKQRLRQPR